MTSINLIRETIEVNETEMNIVVDQFGNNTVAFLADIPKNALVTSVLVNGGHLKTSRNPANEVTVEYPRDEYFEGKRVVAVLYSKYDGNAIVDAARMNTISDMVVEYIETAIAEV